MRRPASDLASPTTLARYVGTYLTPTGGRFRVVLEEDGTFGIAVTGQPFQRLQPWKPHRFRLPEFSDVTIEFVVENDAVTGMKQTTPSGEYVFERE